VKKCGKATQAISSISSSDRLWPPQPCIQVWPSLAPTALYPSLTVSGPHSPVFNGCCYDCIYAWVKRPGREADRSPTSRAEIRNWSYATALHTFLHGLYRVKFKFVHRLYLLTTNLTTLSVCESVQRQILE
jgi:hypothetical protein